jgi:LysR family glycine cleavage system transcriptional activator
VSAAARLRALASASASERACRSSPTAISHQIRQLEAGLGGALFARQTRKVVLIAEGQALYPALRQALDAMAEAVAAVTRRTARRVATLSATVVFTARLLMPRAAGFRTLHPGWDLRLHASDDPVDLHGGEADAAIRYGLRYPDLITRPLLTDSFAPVCSPHTGLREPRDLTVATLIHFEWRGAGAKISVPTWRRWAKRAGISGLDPDAGITFNDENSAIQAPSPARPWRC